MKKKILIPLIAMVVVIAALVVLLPNLFLKSSKKEQQKPEVVDPKVIMDDYNNGKISMDEFVKLNIDNPNNYVPVDLFIYNNIDQLSESTLAYYLEQIDLPNVTFDPDKKNEDDDDSKAGLFAKPVHADENIQNLEEVVLSSKGNFLVWYTTTGKSAITKEQAERIGNGLEDAVEQYKIRFGCDYKFECDYYSRGEKYQDKQERVQRNNIDVSFLDSAMQIYVYEFSETNDQKTVAQYVTRKTKYRIGELYHDVFGQDLNGSIAAPYMRIRPSALSDKESADQLVNHELFHHYQHEILMGHSAPITDMRVFDATANWASALVTPKESSEGFLNEWAHTARKYADCLLSKELINEYKKDGGEDYVSYALFVYLYHYVGCVDDGMNKVLNSIYQKDGFEYLYKSATLEELAKVQEEVAYKKITQDYTNKNFIASPSLNSTVPVKAILLKNVSTKSHTYEENLPRLAMEFYEFSSVDSEPKADLKVVLEKNNNIAAYLICRDDNGYKVIDRVTTNSNKYEFDVDEYKYMCLVVANISLTSQNGYTLTVTPLEETEKETKPENTTTDPTTESTTAPGESTTESQETTQETRKRGKEFLSFEDPYPVNDEVLKEIRTYFFDENGKVCRVTESFFIADITMMDEFLENESHFIYHTNGRYKGNVLQFDYTEEWIEKYESHTTKEKIVTMSAAEGFELTDYDPDE